MATSLARHGGGATAAHCYDVFPNTSGRTTIIYVRVPVAAGLMITGFAVPGFGGIGMPGAIAGTLMLGVFCGWNESGNELEARVV